MSEGNVPAVPVVPDGVDSIDIVGVRHGAFGVSGSGDTSGFGGLVAPIVMPGATPRPYGGAFDEIADEIELSLRARNLPVSSVIEKVVVDRGEITFFVGRDHIVDFARVLRDEPALRFEMCMGVNGVHYPDDEGRELHACYPFLSITHNQRIRVEVTAPDSDPHIPSIVSVYPGNDWHERETWDFFGIVFDGHPALTRIEMPDDWVGHPQRKDYPLGGIPVEYKGATIPAPDNRRAYN
ncbi:MAG: NADH-quinone oxidoreductase subunit C [Candidatus Nanopelagicales bacterium]